jgi:hypothetical protein
VAPPFSVSYLIICLWLFFVFVLDLDLPVPGIFIPQPMEGTDDRRAPIPFTRNGAFHSSYTAPSYLSLLDLRGVYGPKNCERMIVKWACKSKGFKGIMEEEEWELKILDS